jgi:hypothetical protein
MKLTKALLLGAGALTIAAGAILSSATPSDAAVCRARMSGQGTGMGVAGQGSQMARQAALADWRRRVEARHGARFANTARARSVRYDCKPGAILQAECVVSAVPCR